eukprot:tig00000189_g14357.t2
MADEDEPESSCLMPPSTSAPAPLVSEKPNSELAAQLGVYTPLPSTSAPNLALGKPVIASTSAAGGGPWLAVDGRGKDGGYADEKGFPTGYHSNGVENVPWWQVDLGAHYRIGKVVIYNRSDGAAPRLKDFTVTIFRNAQEIWSQHFPVPPEGYNNHIVDILVPEGVQGNLVRIWMPKGGILNLPEVEVFENRYRHIDGGAQLVDETWAPGLELYPYHAAEPPGTGEALEGPGGGLAADEDPHGAADPGYGVAHPGGYAELFGDGGWQGGADEQAWGSLPACFFQALAPSLPTPPLYPQPRPPLRIPQGPSQSRKLQNGRATLPDIRAGELPPADGGSGAGAGEGQGARACHVATGSRPPSHSSSSPPRATPYPPAPSPRPARCTAGRRCRPSPCGPRALDEDGSRSVAASAAGAVHVGPRLPIRIPLKAGVAPLALLRASLVRPPAPSTAGPEPPAREAGVHSIRFALVPAAPSAVRRRPAASAPGPCAPASAAPRLPSPEQGAQEVEAAAVSVRVVPAAERAERVVLRLPPGALACEAGATLPDIPAEVLSETGAPLRLPDEVPGEAPGYVFREVPALREAIRPRRERRARRLRRPRRLRPHRPPGAPHALRVAAEGGATGLQLGTGAALPSLALELLDRFENPAPAPPAPPSASPALSPPRAAVPRTGGPASQVAAAAGPVAWPAGHASVVLSGLTIGDGPSGTYVLSVSVESLPSVARPPSTSTSPTVPRIPTRALAALAGRRGAETESERPPQAQRAERRRREAAARYADQRLRAQPVHLPPPSGAAARLGAGSSPRRGRRRGRRRR